MSDKSYLVRAFEAASETQGRINSKKAERAAKAVKDFVSSLNQDMDGILDFQLRGNKDDPYNIPMVIEKVETGEVIEATLHMNKEVLMRENSRPSDDTVHKFMTVSFGDEVGDVPPVTANGGYYTSLDSDASTRGLQLFIVQRAAAGFEKMHKSEHQADAFFSALEND